MSDTQTYESSHSVYQVTPHEEEYQITLTKKGSGDTVLLAHCPEEAGALLIIDALTEPTKDPSFDDWWATRGAEFDLIHEPVLQKVAREAWYQSAKAKSPQTRSEGQPRGPRTITIKGQLLWEDIRQKRATNVTQAMELLLSANGLSQTALLGKDITLYLEESHAI